MSRILIDPAELSALSALCRNASYDVAGIATEARHHIDALAPTLGADGPRLSALVDSAVASLLRVAAELDDDAQRLAAFGQQGIAADALGDLHGNEHALLTRLDLPGEENQ
jgi:hypothetical protein